MYNIIKTKEELRFFLDADKFALGKTLRPKYFGDEVWKFQIALRKCEYYKNKSGFNSLLYYLYKLKKRNLGLKLGFDIPEGVFGAGLRINHFGNIIINHSSKIGRWCDIHQSVNIGASNPVKRINGEKYTPTIGDNVWIGPGVKIYGNINIGSHVQIGANSVVSKTFNEKITIAGIPAKEIGKTSTSDVDVAANINRSIEFFNKNPHYQKFNRNYD